MKGRVRPMWANDDQDRTGQGMKRMEASKQDERMVHHRPQPPSQDPRPHCHPLQVDHLYRQYLQHIQGCAEDAQSRPQSAR
eukprot:12636144-Prorocentrum_lima.AAC.1